MYYSKFQSSWEFPPFKPPTNSSYEFLTPCLRGATATSSHLGHPGIARSFRSVMIFRFTSTEITSNLANMGVKLGKSTHTLNWFPGICAVAQSLFWWDWGTGWRFGAVKFSPSQYWHFFFDLRQGRTGARTYRILDPEHICFSSL